MALLDKLPLSAKKDILKRLLSHRGRVWSPVCSGQAGIFVASHLDQANAPFNTFFSFRICTRVDEGALWQALRQVVDSHPSLRSHYRQGPSQVEMRVERDVVLDTQTIDVDSLQDAARKASEFNTSFFDLENSLPIRARLYALPGDESVFVLSVHHIAYDGWSMWLLLDDLARNYSALTKGGTVQSEYREAYSAEESIAQQVQLSAAGQAGSSKLFWQEHLKNAIPARLRGDQTLHTNVQAGAAYNFSVENSLVKDVELSARALGMTSYAFMFAVFVQLLNSRTKKNTFVVSTMGAGSLRCDPDYDDRVGYFANLLPVHIRLDEHDDFLALAKKTQQWILDVMEHQDYPIQNILEDYRKTGGRDPHLLGKTAFFFQRPQRRPELAEFMTPGIGRDDLRVDFGGLAISPFQMPFTMNRFDFCLDIYAGPASFAMQIQYKPEMYSEEYVEKFSREFVEQLHAAVRTVQSRRPCLTGGESDSSPIEPHAKLNIHSVSRLEGEPLLSPSPSLLINCFERSVREFSDQPAVTCAGQTLSFRELDLRVRAAHQHLHDQGVEVNDVVALAVGRSIEMVVGLLGICRAGATYLPLDIQFPDSRLQYIIRDAGCKYILTCRELQGRFSESKLLYLEDAHPNLVPDEAGLAAVAVSSECPAYLIYTSGSTGNPKGVVVPHGALINFLLGINQSLSLSSTDTMLVVTTVSFDIAALELFLPLINGAQIVVATEQEQGNGLLLAELLEQSAITFMQATPSTWRLLQTAGWAGDTNMTLLCGGEILPSSLARYLIDRCRRCFNVYGPTETTIWSTIFEVSREAIDGSSVPIGNPLPNQQVYILDKNLAPVDVTEVGEIVIAGAGVSAGYHGLPLLTENKFIPDPFSDLPCAKMYLTGDLGRVNDAGVLEYIGRADGQIKLRGYRIETGEVEAVIETHSGVVESVVVVGEKQEHASLCAFVVADESVFQQWALEESVRHSEAVSAWEDVWDLNYDGASSDPRFDIRGWRDSYDKEPIAASDMRLWRDQIVSRIQQAKPQKILEIGFGSGLLLFELAPDCEQYDGIDLSGKAVQRMRSIVAGDPSLQGKVRVEQGAADKFDVFHGVEYDLIIVNSVLQYFPDQTYLRSVLSGWLERLSTSGLIFCGDVRNLNTLDAFHVSVQSHRGNCPESLEGLNALCRQETELVVDPAFFWTIPLASGACAHARVELKEEPGTRELVSFRYDAWLENRPQPQASDVDWITYQEGFEASDSLRELLRSHQGKLLGIRAIPDQRLHVERRWLEAQRKNTSPIVLSAGLSPQVFYDLAQEFGVAVFVGGPHAGRHGSFDVVFDLAQASSDQLWPHWYSPKLHEDSPALTNSPAWLRFEADLSEQIRENIKRKLPVYMRPEKLLFRRRFPMTLNGKIDRKVLTVEASAALPQRQSAPKPRLQSERVSSSAVSAKIVDIWTRALGGDPVGEHENFFDVGGSSFLAILVHKELEKEFARPLPALLLFENPSVASLAEFISTQEASTGVTNTRISSAQSQVNSNGPVEDIQSDRIAVIGMSGRFPGAESVDEFWANLLDGKEGLKHFSESELLAAGVSDQLFQSKQYVPVRGVLKGVDLFDAGLFGYSAREATITDPQQRLFLECAWEALETAGYDPERTDARIGVFAGAAQNRYGPSLPVEWVRHDDPVESYQYMIGSDKDYLATRVSYKLNLTGPVLSVQTACSTSLVAVHLACRSILSGECDMALAGGVAVHLPHDAGYEFRESMILSPDGHCRPFSENAQGTVPGSGVGIVILKRLDKAIADGDLIDAVIAGSAVNNDGDKKIGFTAPSVNGQEQVIRDALACAHVTAGDIGFVEAHGTATEIGDPIEFEALKRAFKQRDGVENTCAIGSVKSNVGHLDAAAGVTGLIKTVLAVKSGSVPPTLHFDAPNAQIQLEKTPFMFSKQMIEWPNKTGIRRAGVSSFGIGGSNAHAIVEEYRSASQRIEEQPFSYAHILCLSAIDSTALHALIQRYVTYFEGDSPSDLADICFTANSGRRQLPSRAFFVASSYDEFGDALREFLLQPKDASPLGRTLLVRVSISLVSLDMQCALGFTESIIHRHRKNLLQRAKKADLTLDADTEAALTFLQIFSSLGLEMMLGDVDESLRHTLQQLGFLESMDQDSETAMVSAELKLTQHACAFESVTGGDVVHGGFQAEEQWRQLLQLSGLQWSEQSDIDWSSIETPENRRRVRLPTYAFQRRRYWGVPSSPSLLAPESSVKPMQDAQRLHMQWSLDPEGEFRFSDHRVAGKSVVPGAFFLEKIRSLVMQTSANDSKEIAIVENVVFLQPCVVSQAAMSAQLSGELISSGRYRFEAYWPVGTEMLEQLGVAADGRLSTLQALDTREHELQLVRERLKHKRVSLIRFWQQCKALEIEYGPEYRRLEGLWAAENEALALVTCKVAKANDRDIIGLDACLQVIGAALPVELRETQLLPASIDYFAFWASAEKTWSHVRCVSQQADNGDLAVFDIDLYDDESAKLVGKLRGLRLREARQKVASGQQETDWIYKCAWSPVASQEVAACSVLPCPEKVLNRAEFALEKPVDADEYAVGIAELNELVVVIVQTVFCRAGWFWKKGDSFDVHKILTTLHLDLSQQRYIEQLLNMLVAAGDLVQNEKSWTVEHALSSVDCDAELDWLLSKFPVVTHEIALVRRVAERLDQALKGELAFLELLFENGDLSLLRDFYTASYSATSANARLAVALKNLVAHADTPTSISALEIGGGTGATSNYVVPVLLGESSNRYCFTDLAQYFTDSIQSRFTSYDGLSTGIFNVELCPIQQGFASSSYDLVISTNALHATRNLAESLAHIKTVLKPGGWLCLIESTQQSRWVDLTFGGTEGWWRFNDTHIRADHPLLSESTWLEVLRESGFAVTPSQQFVFTDEAVGQSLILVQLGNTETIQTKCQGLTLLENSPLPAIGWSEQEWLQVCALSDLNFSMPSDMMAPSQPCKHHELAPYVLLLPRLLDNQALELFLNSVFDRTVSFLHQLLDIDRPGDRKIVFVTHAAQAVLAEDNPDPVSAALSGLLQVALEECAELNIRLIDLCEHPEEQDYQCLRDAITQWPDEPATAIRKGELLCQRLEKHVNTAHEPLLLDADGAYLITGGTGALGLQTARYLAENGASTLYLVARGKSLYDALVLEKIRAQGVSVSILVADIGDAAQVDKLIEKIDADGRRLAGVVHAAGHLEDGVILNYSWERAVRVIAPKALGAWNLHQSTRSHNLDFFLMYSSYASQFAFAGQADHTAANRFLDALVYHRHHEGLVGTSINWGTWGAVGSAAVIAESAASKALGIRTMPPESAIQLVAPVLASGSAHLAVFDISWSDYFKNGHGKAVFSGFNLHKKQATEANYPADQQVQEKQTNAKSTAAETADQLLQSPVPSIDSKVQDVKQRIIEVVARALGVNVNDVETDRGFFESGLDSLAAINLRKEFEVLFEETLPSTIVFRYPSVDAVVDYYIERKSSLSSDTPAAMLPSEASDNGMNKSSVPGNAMKTPVNKSSQPSSDRPTLYSSQSVDDLATMLRNELNDLL